MGHTRQKSDKKRELRVQKGITLVLLAFFILFISPLVSAGVCNDGLDNDNDGFIDALIELSPYDSSTRLIASRDPSQIIAAVNSYGVLNNADWFFDEAFLLAWGPNWYSPERHTETLDTICNMLGFKHYYYADCKDGEENCNWEHPEHHFLWHVNETGDWERSPLNASDRLINSYLATLQCQGKIPKCSDGLDNDGDGFIDLADDGCVSVLDDSEGIHDPHCDNPTDNDEREELPECSDFKDNDYDGLIDSDDPGCWDDPLNASTYDPLNNFEGKYTITCYTHSDCGSDSSDFICLSGDSYERDIVYTCLNPGTGLSECTEDVTDTLEEECVYGCTDGICDAGECLLDNDCGSDYNSTEFCGADNNTYVTFHDVFCSGNFCGEDTFDILTNTCLYGCSDGSCDAGECLLDSECSSDYNETAYCGAGNHSYTTQHDFSCGADHFCSEETEEILLDTCLYGCAGGTCVPGECLIDSDCSSDFDSSPYCGTDENVYIDSHDFSCGSDNFCSEDVTSVLQETCEYGCTSGTCDPKQDLEGPIVNVTSPEEGSVHNTTVTFVYTAFDVDSNISMCDLHIDSVKTQGFFFVNESGENIFTEDFSVSKEYTAQVICEDTNGNVGSSEIIIFFYNVSDTDSDDNETDNETDFDVSDGPICTIDRHCGSEIDVYSCSGDDLYKTTRSPICLVDSLNATNNSCSEATSTSFVRECADGCSGGRCKSDRSSGSSPRTLDDDTSDIPIINFSAFASSASSSAQDIIEIFSDGSSSVFLGGPELTQAVIDNAEVLVRSAVVIEEPREEVNWDVVLVYILILLIILLLILLVLIGV